MSHTKRKQHRHINDTSVAIPFKCERPDGTAVNLTGKTVKFTMVAKDGTVKVAETETGVTLTDAAAGEGQYDPQTADVDTAGRFFAYVVVIDGAKRDTFPVREEDFEIIIHPD